MFSTFPDGLDGAGLAILRLALGGALAIQVILYLPNRHDWNFSVITIALLTVVSAVFVVAGYRTRSAAMVAAVAIVGAMISFNAIPGTAVLDMRVTEILIIAIAIAIACLGPGFISLDSRLFGRREIVIPRSSIKD